MMEYTKIKDINEYVSQSVNPMKTPDQIFEMYSVPIYETGHPEYLRGDEIASNKVVVQKNDVLLCKINPRINRVWVVADESENMNIASSEWIVIRNSEYNPEYLAWYFRTPRFQKLMVSEVTGIGGSLTRAQPKAVAEYPVPVLKREKQDEIVKVLNKISGVISNRKRELQKLDELIKARFVEMFGDPVANDMGWDTLPLENVCKAIVDCPHSTPSYTNEDTGFMCIRTSIVKKNKILWDDIEYISEDEFAKRIQRKKPEVGDIVYTREGAILGIAAIIDRDCNVALGQRSMLLSPDIDKCTSEFLCVAMNSDSFLDNALRGVSGSASPHINVGDIKAFKMIMPPIELQEQFSDFVKQVDKSKVVELIAKNMSLLLRSGLDILIIREGMR